MKLSTVIELEEKICAARDELARLKSLATATTSRMDGLPHSTSATSRVENYAVKILDYERRLANLREDSLCAQLDLTLDITKRVHGAAGEVLYQRYVLCKPFTEIIAALNYSERAVYNYHRRGVKEYGESD